MLKEENQRVSPLTKMRDCNWTHLLAQLRIALFNQRPSVILEVYAEQWKDALPNALMLQSKYLVEKPPDWCEERMREWRLKSLPRTR